MAEIVNMADSLETAAVNETDAPYTSCILIRIVFTQGNERVFFMSGGTAR